jgi:hypothetical protein
MLSKKLEKKAPIEDAVDVFKYKGKKYSIDTEEYGREIPVFAEDYEHVCRFPQSELQRHYRSRPGIFEVKHLLGARKDWAKQLKNKYCKASASRLTEPDMVCVAKSYGNKPECQFLMYRSLEDIAEVGGGRYSAAGPYWGTKEQMVPQPWRDALYK